MALRRVVDGYVTDDDLPGLRKPTVIDLEKLLASSAGALASAAQTAGVTVEEFSNGVLNKTVFTFDAVDITVTDTGGANGAQGNLQIYDFPAGAILVLGALCNLTTLAGAGGIADDAALVGAVGTAAAANTNATLTATEADIVPSIVGTLTGGAGTLKGYLTTALLASFDGTSTAKDAYLNVAVPDADVSASDTLAVTGTITIFWLNMGDY